MIALSTSFAVIVVLLFQAVVRSAGHKRGREVPLNVPVRGITLPTFINPSVARTAESLLVVMALGLLLVGGCVGYAIGSLSGGISPVVAVLMAVGYLMSCARSMFHSVAWAYADLELAASS
ncbi:MAG: hypothetical protein JHC98_11095 [Thermoleophilaceae bacterium]|nr:hypothetical protein [Thermoleophilaceae bacterium]